MIDRKKAAFGIVLFVMLSIMILFSSNDGASRPKGDYRLEFSARKTESISFYYVNLLQKKIITDTKDINKIITSIQQITVTPYSPKDMPDGGASFVLEFCLKDGSKFLCSYWDTGRDECYFSDGTVRSATPDLHIKKLWFDLEYQAISAYPAKELPYIPAVTTIPSTR